MEGAFMPIGAGGLSARTFKEKRGERVSKVKSVFGQTIFTRQFMFTNKFK
jgi:hypothetical protein